MSDTPRCPRCGSTNTDTSVDYKIKKGLGYAAEFGIGYLAGRYLGDAGVTLVEDVSIADGVDKEWQCNDCGHIWRGIANASHPSYTQTPTLKIVNELGEEVEVSVTEFERLRNLPFYMKVEDYFHIEGRGDVVTGRIEKGGITIGDEIVFNNNLKNTAVVTGIEIFRKLLDCAEVGDNVGLLLRGNGKINKGDILTKLQETEQKNSSQDNVRTDTSSDNTNEKEYLDEVKECLADGELGGSERRLLNKLRVKLGISEERAAELEASLQKPQLTEEEQEYLEAYQDAMEDGVISEKERRILDKLMKINNISEERAKEIEMLN